MTESSDCDSGRGPIQTMLWMDRVKAAGSVASKAKRKTVKDQTATMIQLKLHVKDDLFSKAKVHCNALRFGPFKLSFQNFTSVSGSLPHEGT